MLPRTAFLVDADFFLRRWRFHLGADALDDPFAVAIALRKHCVKHLYWRQEQIGRLYRIFVYDCPPLAKKAHNPGAAARSISQRRIWHASVQHFMTACGARLTSRCVWDISTSATRPGSQQTLKSSAFCSTGKQRSRR